MKRGTESGRERGREGKKKKRFHNTFTLCLNYWEKIEQIQQILFWDCLKICIIMNDTSKKQFLVQRSMLLHLGSILVASKDIPFHVYG